MKILYVITRSDVIGGASIHLLDLVKGMTERGHKVRVLIGGSGVFFDKCKKLNIDIISLRSLTREINFSRDIKAYFELKSEINNFSPELVHLHSSKAGVIGRLAAYKCGVKSVFTAHGWAFTEGVSSLSRFFYTQIEKKMSNYCNRIITVSDFDRKLALLKGVAESKKVVTVINGVSDNAFKLQSGNRDSSSKLDEPVRFIMVARFDEQKNQKLLLSSLSEISNLNFKFSFVGDGALLDTCISYAEELGLSSKVEFLGARNDVPNLLHDSDVFVLISNWEGLPLTILEAMSHSIPVIASDVGGVREIIRTADDGFLIPRSGKSELKNAIEILINDPLLRKKLGKLARERYEIDFTANVMISKTENIYNELLNEL